MDKKAASAALLLLERESTSAWKLLSNGATIFLMSWNTEICYGLP